MSSIRNIHKMLGGTQRKILFLADGGDKMQMQLFLILSFSYPEVISLHGHFTLFKQMNKIFKLYLAPWTHRLSSAYYPALSHYLQILQISYIVPRVSLHISLLWHMFMSMPRKHFTSFIYSKCHQLW